MAVQGATVDVSTTAVALNVADSSWAPPPSSTVYSPPANSHNYQP